ncbi:hypothetical protein BsWGS_24511 [Bradybaena similaris]
MQISRTPEEMNIQVSGAKIKQVEEYLGSIFSEDGKTDREIETRCQTTNFVTTRTTTATATATTEKENEKKEEKEKEETLR